MLLKTCTRCSASHPPTIEFFYRHKECRGGVDSVCRACRNAERNAWKHRNRDRLAQERRAAYAADNGEKHKAREAARRERAPYRRAAEGMQGGVWDRARKSGLVVAPELKTKSFIEAWLRRQPQCECCGVDFCLEAKGGRASDASPSLDRFYPEQGYTLENVSLICWRCNRIKCNFRAADLLLVADWMIARQNEAERFNDLVMA
jgi:hypothetical protein